MTIYDFIDSLCCPDCKVDIERYREDLICPHCGRIFKVYHRICVDMLPKKKFQRSAKTEVERKSIVTYNRLFDEPFVWKVDPVPWGLNVPQNYVSKLKKHKHILNSLISQKIGIGIDISAGSGRFSWDLVNRAGVFVFFDISVDSVVYLSKKILEENTNKAIVVRGDYMYPPFKNDIFDFCVCNDTLIYGYEHEVSLLRTINMILKWGGIALLDFSYKYHRGFWHKPYTVAYSLKQMIKMLNDSGFTIECYKPIYYELSNDLDEVKWLSKLIKLVLPPTRYIFKVKK